MDLENKLVKINYLDNRVYTGQANTDNLLPHGKGKVLFPDTEKKIYY